MNFEGVLQKNSDAEGPTFYDSVHAGCADQADLQILEH